MGHEETLLVWQRRLSVIALATLLVLLALVFCNYFADILRILGVSVLLAYLLIQAVDWLEPWLRSRAAAVLLVYVVLVMVTVVAIVIVVPNVVYQVAQLTQSTFDKLPEFVQWLTRALSPLEARLKASQINVRAIDLLSGIAANAPKPEPTVIIGRVTEVAMSTATWVIYALSIGILSFYFLLDGHRMKNAIIRLFPTRRQQALQIMAADMDRNLQAFFRGQVVLALLAGMVMLWVYVALGVSYPLLLSVFLAVWEIVPVIGPPIGFFPAIIAVAVNGMSFFENRFLQILILTLIFQVLQWLKDNVLAPRYIGNVIGVHPVVIFIAIMIGARVDGMVGIILALPVACVINVFMTHWPALIADAPDTTGADTTSESGAPS